MEWKVLRPEDLYDAGRLAWFRAEGYWRDIVLWEVVDGWANDQPEDLAVVDDHRSITIGELRDAAARLAGGLSRRGVTPGDRVLVQLTNRVEAAICICGVARLGAVLVPVQPALRRHDVQSLLARTEAVAMVSIARHRGFDHTAMIRELRPEVPMLRDVFLAGGEAQGMVPFDELLGAEPYSGPLPDPDAPALVIFTSGTTAQPKGCVHTWNTFIYMGRGVGAALGVRSDDVMFMPSPLMHTTGMAVGLLIPLLSRIPAVLQGQWEAEAALDIIADQHCTMTLGATPFATQLLEAYDPDRHDISGFRLFGLGGSPIPSLTVERLRRVLGCDVVTLYGSTEGLVLTATRPGDSADRIASSDGVAVDGVEVAITDDAGDELERGAEGEIRIRAPGRFLCYWDDDERTREAIDEQGRLRTGDLARMDPDGYIRLTGRSADLIIRGGMNISAAEVEGFLIAHPDVQDVAIVSMPDARMGEKACAFVVPGAQEPTLTGLTAVLEQRGVAKFKYPERIEIVSELPRNASGKVEKFKLRARIRELLSVEPG